MISQTLSIQPRARILREESTSLDAQNVYPSLLDVFHDHLSTTLTSSKLQQELTLMKLDDKWCKSFESFLHFWTAKVQGLESIEDKLVDDVTRHHGTGKTFHSVSQLRDFGTIVDNTPRSFGGKQHLETLDGYIIPLSIRSGLPYVDMTPPTPTEFDSYPQVFFTSDMEWNPQTIVDVDEYTVHDTALTGNDLEHNEYHHDTINAYGELLTAAHQQDIHFRHQRRNHPDVEQLSPNFGLSLYPAHVRPYNLIWSFRISFTYAQTLQKPFSCC
jgi:hypothetical protein